MGVPGFQEDQAPEAEGELLMLSVNAMEEAYESSGSRLTADLVRRISSKVGQALLRLPPGSAGMHGVFAHRHGVQPPALDSPSACNAGDSVEGFGIPGVGRLGRDA